MPWGLSRWTLAPVIAGPVVALGVMFTWAFDRAGDDEQVLRNVSVAGVDVSGMDGARLQAAVARLAADYDPAVVVDAGNSRIEGSARDFGLRVDQRATAEAAMAVGRRGFPAGQFTSWLGSLVSRRTVDVRLGVDADAVRAALIRLDDTPNARPVEPGFTVNGSQVIAHAGTAGSTVDPSEVTSALRRARFGANPVRISVKRHAVEPRHSIADAQALVEKAKQLTAAPLTVAVNNTTLTLAPETLRSWLEPSLEGGPLDVGINADLVSRYLGKAFEKATVPPADATMTLDQAGNLVVVAGRDGAKCCAPTAAEVILQALRNRPQVGLVLPTVPVPPAVTPDDVAKLGIKEAVGTFSTRYVANQPRVINIQRIADLVRGQIIKPGETLSINKLVGPRTVEKGFVEAPAIVDGNLHDFVEVGGGVSQFMTTLFNAAYFAGLDYGEYQSHSLYINRYPYGREATINWPSPDLQIKNTTPYGVLVWNTYTDTSITVTLYSTKFLADVRQGNYTEVLAGSCTDVRTERLRTYLDGKVVKDIIRARYQAADSVKCTDPFPEGVIPQHNPAGPTIPLPTTTTTTLPPTTPPPTTAAVPTTLATTTTTRTTIRR